jgi:hypothetical protein
MTKMIERLDIIEHRLRVIEQELGIIQEEVPIEKVTKKQEVPFEKKINGFSVEQLKVMFSWAQSIDLTQLSKGDYEELKKWQMLHEFFPDAPMNYDEINK